MASSTISNLPISCLVCLLITISGTNAVDRMLDIPPRLQWGANYGYCGEVALISAGLYYGQYCSQYDARALAAPGVAQSNANSQLLVGVNALRAAAAMRLDAREFSTFTQTTDSQFVDFIEREVLLGRPVIIGMFQNIYRFYGRNRGGDPDYDHIVPVTGVTNATAVKAATFSSKSLATGRLYWSDNGLWAPNNVPQYLFNDVFSTLFRSRTQANQAAAPLYSINNNKRDYGMSVYGVLDPNKNTIRVKLATNVSFESPSIKNGQTTRPTAMPLELTATVEIPDQNVAYNLYRYSAFASIPMSSFNANAGNATQVWRIPALSGPRYTVKINIKSDQVAAFRAVRTTAP